MMKKTLPKSSAAENSNARSNLSFVTLPRRITIQRLLRPKLQLVSNFYLCFTIYASLWGSFRVI